MSEREKKRQILRDRQRKSDTQSTDRCCFIVAHAITRDRTKDRVTETETERNRRTDRQGDDLPAQRGRFIFTLAIPNIAGDIYPLLI